MQKAQRIIKTYRRNRMIVLYDLRTRYARFDPERAIYFTA